MEADGGSQQHQHQHQHHQEEEEEGDHNDKKNVGNMKDDKKNENGNENGQDKTKKMRRKKKKKQLPNDPRFLYVRNNSSVNDITLMAYNKAPTNTTISITTEILDGLMVHEGKCRLWELPPEFSQLVYVAIRSDLGLHFRNRNIWKIQKVRHGWEEILIEVNRGEHIQITDDPYNPPLSVSQCQTVYQTVRDMMERDEITDHTELTQGGGRGGGGERRNDQPPHSTYEALDVVSRRCLSAAGGVLPRTGKQIALVYNSLVVKYGVNYSNWTNYYQPIIPNIDAQAFPDVLQRVLQGPFLVHAYWREPNEFQERVAVRYSLDVSPSSSSGRNLVQVHYYHQSFSAGPPSLSSPHHTLYGPHTSHRFLPVNQEEAEESDLHTRLSTILSTQTRVNSDCQLLGRQVNFFARDWPSCEIVLFARSWCKDFHQHTPKSFQERVKTFLLINNRLSREDNSGLVSDCCDRIVEWLYQVDTDPVPVFRYHQRSIRNAPRLHHQQHRFGIGPHLAVTTNAVAAFAATGPMTTAAGAANHGRASMTLPNNSTMVFPTPTTEQLALTRDVSDLIGITGIRSFMTQSNSCEARQEIQEHLLDQEEDEALKWRVKGFFGCPLVFRFF